MRGLSAFPYQLLAICGIFLTNVINYIIASYGSRSWDVNTGWRWMLGLGAIPAAAFLLSMVRAPESPRSSFKPAEPKRDSRCSSTSSAPNRHAFALTTSMHRSNSKPKCRMNFTTCSARGCGRRSSSAL
ncbi:MFS transporter [Bifidobacterium breve]|uniref:MFS transporter n=1 Tax=Bifidobacterium breve TaxID=1685 RepID=UPI003D7830D9